MTFKITYESIRTEVSSYIYIYILHMTLYIYIYKNLLRAVLAVSCLNLAMFFLLGQMVKCFKCTCKCSEVRLYARIYLLKIYMIFMIGI